MSPLRIPTLFALFLLLLVEGANAQETAAGTIPWQRTIGDALAVANKTGRPVLVAVNNDGETASDRLVRNRYKSASFIAKTAGFVPIILSPVRHTPKDHRSDGSRIPCPRFGSVTCGEHMRAEPVAFARWFKGRRVAPRHVGVEPDGETVLFDLFLLNSLYQIDEALERYGRVGREDRSPRFQSRDARDRAELEARFLDGDRSTRRALLAGIRKARVPAPDLVRMALVSGDEDLLETACEILAETAEAGDEELLRLAISRGDPEGAEALLAALERIAPDETRAMRSAVARRALKSGSKLIRPSAWKRKLGREEAPEPPPGTIEELGRALEEAYALSEADPSSGDALLAVARAHVDFALFELRQGGNPSFHLRDAEDRAREARGKGASREEVDALRTLTAWYLGETERVPKLFEPIARRLVKYAATADAARALEVFALARTREIYAERSDWEASSIADVLAAGEVLEVHPMGSAQMQTVRVDLLGWLGLSSHQGDAVRSALKRFPADGALHGRLRDHVSANDGFETLEAVYAELAPPPDASAKALAAHEWFAGYALLVVAEGHRKARATELALAAYDRAEERFAKSAATSEEHRSSSEDHIAHAHLGRANTVFEARDYDATITHILAAIELRPEVLDWSDGLGVTGATTLARLRSTLAQPVYAETAARLETGLRAAGIAPEGSDSQDSD